MGLCVFKEGGGVGLPGGGEGLQRDVGGLSAWAEGGGMGFNQAKWWVLLEDCGGERLEDRGVVTGGLEWLEDQGAERLEDRGAVTGGPWGRKAGGPRGRKAGGPCGSHWRTMGQSLKDCGSEWLEDRGAVAGGP